MPQEVLGGNSPRRARLHKEKSRGARGVPARTKEFWLQSAYSEVRDAAVEHGVFEVGLTKAELAKRLSDLGA